MECTWTNEREKRQVIIRLASGDDPYEECSLGLFLGLPDQSYNWGQEQITQNAAEANWQTPQEMLDERIKQNDAAGGQSFLVSCYEHGGIALSLEGFSDDWDGRIVGAILVTPATREIVGTPTERIKEVVESELADYAAYMNNEMYVADQKIGRKCGECGHWTWENHGEKFGVFYGQEPENSELMDDAGVPRDADEAASAGWTRKDGVDMG